MRCYSNENSLHLPNSSTDNYPNRALLKHGVRTFLLLRRTPPTFPRLPRFYDFSRFSVTFFMSTRVSTKVFNGCLQAQGERFVDERLQLLSCTATGALSWFVLFFEIPGLGLAAALLRGKLF